MLFNLNSVGVQRALNVCIRFATLIVRFLFIFFLAKYLSAELVGYYGIFTATVGYAIYFVGLDYYTFVSRKIVSIPSEKQGQLLKGQAFLSLGLYVLLIPIMLTVLIKMNWPSYLIIWFIPILVLEHFNQEMTRLLIALQEQLASSVVLFFRQGSWALVAIVAMMLDESVRSLGFVMAIWACAGIIAAVVAIINLKKLGVSGWALPVDWSVVRAGVATSLLLLIATLSIRGVQTFDRYWIEALTGIESVAPYVLFMGVAGTLLVFLDAAVFSFGYPSMIRLIAERKYLEFQKTVKIMLLQVSIVCVAFSLVSWLLLPVLLKWIGNPVYANVIGLYPWILSAMVINALSMVPHYGLYTQGVDRAIVTSHISALLVFLGSTYMIGMVVPERAVVLGLNCAFMWLLIVKGLVYVCQPNNMASHTASN